MPYNDSLEAKKYRQRYYEANKEYIKERDKGHSKRYRESHPDYDAQWREKNRDHIRTYHLNWCHENGSHKSMKEDKNSSQYLGIYIAERVLSKYFDNIIIMPHGNPNYDYICGKGYKIDVKSGCLLPITKTTFRWTFNIWNNDITDYFLCLAFNNREELEPLHIWLIPSKVVSDHKRISISNNPKSLAKWTKYERSLDKVIECCNKLKTED
jgi:hypothetical protein